MFLLDLLCLDLEEEHPHRRKLFREDSCFTIAFARYSMLVGLPFIWRLLHNFVADLQADPVSAGNDVDLELDPNESQELQQSLLQLKNFSGRLLLLITSSHKALPPPLVYLCRKICAIAVAASSRTKRKHSPVGNLIFLRFFSKAMLSAEDWGLVTKQMTSRLRRNLLLLSKGSRCSQLALEASATGEVFDADNFMSVLNPVIEDFRRPMKEFYRQLLTDR